MLSNGRKLKKSSLGSRAHGPVSTKAACPKYFVENPGVLSDSDEADNEVEKLTALSFQSLSCPQGSYLDMYSSSNRTSSSLSNSLPEDCNGMNRWPACSEQRKTVVAGHAKGGWQFSGASKAPETELLSGVLGKEHFECIDVTLENADGKKSLSKKRMVPKRQIQLRRKEKKEIGFCAAGECATLQARNQGTQSRKESCVKGRSISDEFRINYKQFLKAASLNNAYNKTRLASSLVRNVLAKKMQYEQRIKMEQASIQGSSTSSVPSSVSTDIQGDSLEGKSSSLSKSDCSFSTEDMQSHSTTSEKSESIAVSKDSMDGLRPTKGVVLNEQLREKVCKLKNTFNELNERMKYQEATQLKRLPILAESGVNMIETNKIRKQVSGERKEYRRARAVFESMQADTKSLAAVPKFAKPQKPWPNLKQRAIRQNKHTQSKEEMFPIKPKSLMVPKDAPSNIFTSKTKEMKLIPQIKNEHSIPHAPRHPPLDRISSDRRLPTFQSMKLSSVTFPSSSKTHSEKSNCLKKSCTEKTTQMESKGKIRIHPPRDVRKLVNDSYSHALKSSDSSSVDQASYSESKSENNLTVLPRDSMAISPLFIHCTSICRKDDSQTVNSIQEKKEDQAEDLDLSALSLLDDSTSGRESSDNFYPTGQLHENKAAGHPENKCSAVGESPVHITTIQSKKLVAENKECQPQVENKPVPYERSELNVRPSSSAAKKESQLNIKVNSSISKQSHKTETDYFPASSCSTLDERTIREALPQSNHSLLRENKAVVSSEAIVIPSTASLQEITRRDHGSMTTSHIQEPCKTQELPYPKHLSSEVFSVAPRDTRDLSSFLKEENKFSESASSRESCRHSQATSTQNIQTQTPTSHHVVDSATETKGLEDTRPLERHNRIHSEYISDSPQTREYSEGIKVISNSSFTPSASCKKLPDSGCDYFNNKPQMANEQYFSATQADNTNYLTIPVKAQQPEAPAKYPLTLPMDNTSFSSNVSFQPSGEASGNKISNEFYPPKQMERKAASDNVLYPNNPSHSQLPLRLEESPNFTRRNERTSPSGKTAPSPTRHFAAPPLQAHRKMLVDPESGKCYYVESPRQPQLKMLYDPETGQYIEVLIPPVPLTSHGGLYQSPFSSVVMNAGGYGPPYMSYSGFPGFPPPPPAAPPAHLDLQDQQPIQDNANITESFNHFSKNEAPPPAQTADGNYMESLYYIPTGMNSSPNPNQALFSPTTNSGPSLPEKGSFFRV
ncbi:proline-rich basic protein 1 [Sceloporus undulatus]|uniref:proline-rich basic protein 1 n=1 Tax=Sceloporus undulatus TaxID=8520 RepID=UPI001C4AD85A|nr:proline-rich basic protein 1 [Sceloporus undulatus]